MSKRHRDLFLALGVIVLGALSVFSPVRLLAQAPIITSAGDPSVKSDTIYKLRVNPDDYKDHRFVTLLDDGVITIEPDGRMRRTYRTVAQILTEEGAKWMDEQVFSYSGSKQKFTLNWAHVISSTGKILSDKPSHERDTEGGSGGGYGTTIYTDVKTHGITMPGLEPGTIVDYSYTLEDIKPVMPGEFLTYWSITTSGFIRRTRLIVDIPKTLTVRIRERNLPRPRITKDKGNRRVYTWAAKDLAKVEPEPFMSDSNNTLYSNVIISSNVTWENIAEWYTGLSKDRYTVTAELNAKVKEITSNARTLEDSVRAVHRWIAQDIRYVSILLGDGGHQPRMPASVLETQYGDCKDKATLFIAIMRNWGLNADPVLVNSYGRADRNIPGVGQFNHMIAALELNGKWNYVDLTVPIAPFGEIPPEYQGSFALKIGPNGGEQIEIPKMPIEHNSYLCLIEGTLTDSGAFVGKYSENGLGAAQYALRNAFMEQMDKEEKVKLTRNLASNVFDGAEGDSLKVFDGKDLLATPHLSLHLRAENAARATGDAYIMEIPLFSFGNRSIVQMLQSKKERKTWIDVEEVSGSYMIRTYEFLLALPEGWKADLPKNVTVKSAFGEYQASYSQDGRNLHIIRKLIGAQGVQPPTAMPELIDWIKGVSADDAKFIVLKSQ